MNVEQIFFLQVLKNHLAGEKTCPIEDIEWDNLIAIAKIHQVEGILFYQCKDFVPDQFRSSLESIFHATLFYYINRENDLKEVKRLFNKSDISLITVKGLSVASCYPAAALRTMGDIDILVHREDKEKAGELLESLGYNVGVKAPDYDWAYFRNKSHFELHHQLLYDEPSNPKLQVDFFNKYWNYVRDGSLDWSFHFLFLIAHLRKHMLYSGAGFRMFYDIAAVIRNDPGLNWKWIEEKLNYLEMDKFSSTCFFLIENWFGVKAPVSYDQLDVSFLDYATEKIFANGIFGFDDANNRLNGDINKILQPGKSKSIARVQMTIRYLFPKYIHMRYIPYYSFIEGRPWLLPAAWGYRVIRLLSGKDNGTRSFINNLQISDREIESREKELRRWGLIE